VYKTLTARSEVFRILVGLSSSCSAISVFAVVAMLKLRALPVLLVSSLSAGIFASPLNPLARRSVDVDLHIVNKQIAPDGFQREYVSSQAPALGAHQREKGMFCAPPACMMLMYSLLLTRGTNSRLTYTMTSTIHPWS
jgi:hypothetical protein